MPEDHVRRVAGFERYPVYVLYLSQPVRDERVSQNIPRPLAFKNASSVTEAGKVFAPCVRPDARASAWRYCQPQPKIVRDWHDAPRSCLGLVRGYFNESRPFVHV